MPFALRFTLFFILMIVCALPVMSSALCLLVGIGFSLTLGHPCAEPAKRWIKIGLGIVITCLGAGMNIGAVLQAGQSSIALTAGSISATLILGYVLGRLFKTPVGASILISFGTAICGGSAIAALAPAMHAKNEDTSIALGCVFILNALALLLFPMIGHALDMSQSQFGLWAALAIHDTSSVVGAASQYGAEALNIATIVKLVRALWIVPFVLAITFAWKHMHPEEQIADDTPKRRALVPWFIYGFLGMPVLFSLLPNISFLPLSMEQIGHGISYGGKRLMEVILFLIGASLSRETLRAAGAATLGQALLLWLCVGSVSAWAILQFAQ